MKTKLILIAAIWTLAITCFAQQNSKPDIWERLIGEWKGEGSGQPGQGGGTFSFAYDLDKKIIVHKSHSEYPARDNKPLIIHDDLMIIYSGKDMDQSKAVYFDNEGHVINYSVNYTDTSVIMTSDKIPDTPVFRLSYTFQSNDIINTRFEISQDSIKYTSYIEGICRKIK